MAGIVRSVCWLFLMGLVVFVLELDTVVIRLLSGFGQIFDGIPKFLRSH